MPNNQKMCESFRKNTEIQQNQRSGVIPDLNSFCHGDLHRENLLETVDGKIYLLNFDTIVEIYGIDCIDNHFFDKQLEWLES